jgi:hypothetical protein
MSRIPHCLDNRLTVGGEVVSLNDWATGWTTEEFGFSSREGQNICLVQAGSGAHPTSYPTVKGDRFKENKAAEM